MRDYIESNYTKTCKKVKSIDYSRVDLTYNKVYDVFIDSDEYEFIIDDVGHKRYVFVDNKNYYELVDDVADNTHEIKLKFKVGDKVKVVNSDYISDYTRDVKVGDIGTLININEGNVEPYRVNFDENGNIDCWWFTDKCIELVDDVGNDIHDTNEQKLKFKVGDKVRVVDIDYISDYTDDVKVGDIGMVINIKGGGVENYQVDFKETDDKYCWWFTDDCIELVDDNDVIENNTIENTSIVSDGGSSSYYAQQIPKGMLERFNTTGTIEAKDVIRLFLGNDFNMGNIFKAYCRIISLRNGKGKAGIDEQYDLTKAKFFAEDELNNYLENRND